jgi:kinesin family member C1
MLQDTNKRLQEYNTSLQQYNCNLQADATKNAETIVKLQKEKNTMVETMNGLKDHANSVKMQLDIARVKSLSLYVLSLSTRFFIEFVYREFY